MQKGTTFGGEYGVIRDPETGAVIHQLTRHASINHSFFFLNPSFQPGQPPRVGFVTHRDGMPQCCLFDFATRTARCLTDREHLQPFSPAFSPDGSRLYFTTRQGEVWMLDLASLEETRLASLPAVGVGECSPSPDGRSLVTAFKRGGRHGLLVVDIASRTSHEILEGDLKLIHPQFHPANSDLILYAGDPAPRLWTIRRDGTDATCLYQNSPREFFVHESFLGHSDDVIFAVWPYRLCRLNRHARRGRQVAELDGNASGYGVRPAMDASPSRV